MSLPLYRYILLWVEPDVHPGGRLASEHPHKCEDVLTLLKKKNVRTCSDTTRGGRVALLFCYTYAVGLFCLSQMEPLGSSCSIEKLGYVLEYAKTSLIWLLWVTQCAGNRRTAMSNTRKVKGVGWDVSAIGNGLFSRCTLFLLILVSPPPVYVKHVFLVN